MKTPVLFLVFNRPDTTGQVLAAIREARPERLYIAADGPRAGRNEEAKCRAARVAASQVDWPCTVATLFRETNLGCRDAVSTAIDYFFENEEEGIVLEDDCVPSPSFFGYCSELLERYRNDQRVFCISANNYQRGDSVTEYSYYFSRYNHSWGWATWRRAWQFYDRDMTGWPEFKAVAALRAFSDSNLAFERYWTRIFDRTAARQIDTWDYVWTYSIWAQGGLTCLPSRNLVMNIGFSEEATHTTEASWLAGLRREDLPLPLRHPPFVVRNVEADVRTNQSIFGIYAKYPVMTALSARLKRRARRLGRRLGFRSPE